MAQHSDLTEEQEKELWRAWAEMKDMGARQRLAEYHLPFANMLAAKLYAGRQIEHIEFEEYRQYAIVGMMEALDRFDANRNASFKTYAAHRITGCILNGIEKSCEKQQQITARASLRQQRLESLKENGAKSEKDLFSELAELAIGLALGYMLENSGMYHTPEEEHYTEHFYNRYELQQLKQMLNRNVESMPEQARCVIRYHYYQGLSFEEVARIMGLSKGRISQIHSQALKQLRQMNLQSQDINCSL